MSELRKSLLISFLNKYSILVITIISSMIIARLLSPKEIGVFSVGAALIGIAHTVRDFGVSNYLIQEKQINNEKIRSAFTLTLMMAWSIASLLLLSKGFIAEFYNQGELKIIIMILAGNFFILPFNSVSIALLKREMQFSTLYKITTISALIQAITVISLALLGFSFYSLAWGGLANVLVTLLITQSTKPGFLYFSLSLNEIKPILNFGANLSLSSLAFEAGNFAPDLIIGKLLGFTSVGVFSRAQGFVSIIEQTITDAIRPILLPYFSKENRNGREIKTPFLKLANYYLAVTLPLLGLIAILAYPMIRLLYGYQWDSAVPITQMLCIGIAFKSLNFLMSSAILSLGQAKKVMTAQVSYQFMRISAISYGAFHGLLMIAYCLSAVELVGFFIFHSKMKSLQINLKNVLIPFFKNAYLMILVTIPALISYLIQVNFDSIIQISDQRRLLQALNELHFMPINFSQLDNLRLIAIPSFLALVTWMITIQVINQELWIELTQAMNSMKFYFQKFQNKNNPNGKKKSNKRYL